MVKPLTGPPFMVMTSWVEAPYMVKPAATRSVPGRQGKGSSIPLTRLSGGLLGWEMARTAMSNVSMVLHMFMLCWHPTHFVPLCMYFVCVCVVLCGVVDIRFISISIELKRSQEEEVGSQPDFDSACFAAPASARGGGRFRIGRERHQLGGEYDAPALEGAAPYVA